VPVASTPTVTTAFALTSTLMSSSALNGGLGGLAGQSSLPWKIGNPWLISTAGSDLSLCTSILVASETAIYFALYYSTCYILQGKNKPLPTPSKAIDRALRQLGDYVKDAIEGTFLNVREKVPLMYTAPTLGAGERCGRVTSWVARQVDSLNSDIYRAEPTQISK
jgi:hypothetical protein